MWYCSYARLFLFELENSPKEKNWSGIIIIIYIYIIYINTYKAVIIEEQWKHFFVYLPRPMEKMDTDGTWTTPLHDIISWLSVEPNSLKKRKGVNARAHFHNQFVHVFCWHDSWQHCYPLNWVNRKKWNKLQFDRFFMKFTL